jgi:hypothetical protein
MQVPGVVNAGAGNEGVELLGPAQHRWATRASAQVPGEVGLYQHTAPVS